MCHPVTFSNSFVPATDIAYPDPITGHFFGIDVPSTVPFYDVRISDNFPQPKALYGETLYSAERISYKLGLRTGWYPQKCDTPIISVQFSFDARSQLFVENIAGRINWVIDEFQKREKVYTLAGKYHNPDDGGSVFYRPVFCYLANFGIGIVGTSENYHVIPFGKSDQFEKEKRQICNA